MLPLESYLTQPKKRVTHLITVVFAQLIAVATRQGENIINSVPLQYHHYIELMAALTGCMLYRSTWPIQLKVLAGLACLTFAVELAGHLIGRANPALNQFIYNLFSLIQSLVLLWVIRRSTSDKRTSLVTKSLLVGLLAVNTGCYIMQPNPMLFNHYAATIDTILMLIGCCIFFIDALINNVNILLYRQPAFWIVTGMLMYTSIFIIRFSMWGMLETLPDYQELVHYTNVIANTFFYLGYSGSFICQRATPKYSS